MVFRWKILSLGFFLTSMAVTYGQSATFAVPLEDGTEATVHVFSLRDGGEKQSTILMWHGGGWSAGGPYLLFPHAEALAAEGYLCLVPEYPLATPTTGIEQCVEDARAIARWVLSDAGPAAVDRDEVYMLGESAGGHLAAMLASDPETFAWAGLILWNPVLDLREIPWLETRRQGPLPDRAALSPVTRLTASHPPTLLLHGTDDEVVPAAQAMEWRETALDHGIPARVTLLPETKHAFAMPASPEAPGRGFTEAMKRTLNFLRLPKRANDRRRETLFHPVHAFSPETGWQPFTELSRQGDAAWGGGHAGGAHGRGTLFRLDLSTETLDIVHHFSETEGYEPFTGLTFGDDAVWGVTKFGGPGQGGTLYRFQPSTGELAHLVAFGPNKDPVAWHPHAGPILVEGYLWGTTFHGGPSRWGGTLYRVPGDGGALELMQGFNAETGEHPTGQLLLHDGWIYGTLSDYGKEDPRRAGALFRIRPDGSGFEVVHRFAGGGLGAHPYDRLVPHPAGYLLGTTFGRFGELQDRGTLFAWDPDTREVTTLIDFNLLPSAGGKPNGSVALEIDPMLSNPSLLLTTHGALDTDHGFPGSALRVNLASNDPIRVDRIEILHTFSGDAAGSTPMRTPVIGEGKLWGLTAFGHATEAAVQDPTQTGGLLYRLDLPPPLTTASISDLLGSRALQWLALILVGVVFCGVVLFFLRK